MDLALKKTLKQRYSDFMPLGAGALFFIQMCSTLSFSVLYSTLILYATKGLHLNDTLATSITGSFVALNYFLHLIGGYIGGRYLSYRSLFAVGMVFNIIGCVLISVPEVNYLLWGLAAFLTGAGLNVTCINCMVTQLFEPNDKRRESAFLWNYSGMNIGFFVGFAIGGYYHLTHAYTKLFLLSALGNLIALLLTFYNWKKLRDRDTPYINTEMNKQRKQQILGAALIFCLFFAIRFLLNRTEFCNNLMLSIGAGVFVLLFMLSLKESSSETRKKMWAYIFFAASSLMFWTLYQLAPMGLNLFIERNVDRHFLGYMVAPQWVQNINTAVIIIGGPIFGLIFNHLRERGFGLSIPLQFSIGLLCIGTAFCILPLGISFANPAGLTGFNWIFTCFILQSIGELFISPVGYAMVGQMAPVSLRGLMMGSWMMLSGLAAVLSDHFSKLALSATGSVDPLVTNAGFSHTFGLLGWSAIGAGVLSFLLIPIITRLTNEHKLKTKGEERRPQQVPTLQEEGI